MNKAERRTRELGVILSDKSVLVWGRDKQEMKGLMLDLEKMWYRGKSYQ